MPRRSTMVERFARRTTRSSSASRWRRRRASRARARTSPSSSARSAEADPRSTPTPRPSEKSKAMMAAWDLHYLLAHGGLRPRASGGPWSITASRTVPRRDAAPTRRRRRSRARRSASSPRAARHLRIRGGGVAGALWHRHRLAASPRTRRTPRQRRPRRSAGRSRSRCSRRDIPHKTEAKAVALDVADAAALRRAWRAVLANARALRARGRDSRRAGAADGAARDRAHRRRRARRGFRPHRDVRPGRRPGRTLRRRRLRAGAAHRRRKPTP